MRVERTQRRWKPQGWNRPGAHAGVRVEVALLAEQLSAAGIGLEFLTGELQGSHDASGACSPCWPRCRGWNANTSATAPWKAANPPVAAARAIGGATVTDPRPCRPWPCACASKTSASARSPARLVITQGKKNGWRPSPATVFCATTTSRTRRSGEPVAHHRHRTETSSAGHSVAAGQVLLRWKFLRCYRDPTL